MKPATLLHLTVWPLLANLMLTATADGQDLRADLELGPGSSIALNELAILSIRVDGAIDRRVQPEADFELDNFRVASGPSTASSLLFQDGTSSRSLTLTWYLQPLAPGTARVHSASLRLGTRKIPLPEDQLKILEVAPAGQQVSDPGRDPFAPWDALGSESPDDSPAAALRGDPALSRRRQPRPLTEPKIYLSAEVEPSNPYVGEQLLYTLYLFTQVDVRSVNPEELPDFKGFWSRVVPQPDQLRPNMILRKGERIGRVVLLQRALFPRRAGRFTIGPVQARLAALMPDSGPTGSILPRTREILRSSDAVTIDVREPPPPPAGFQGAVGQIEVTAELNPAELEVGDAATLSLTLTGRGHFQGLPPPVLGELPGISIFPPQQQSNTKVERKYVSGERTWNFVLVPEQPGTWQLPPIEIPFFDPKQERYRIASAAPKALTVTASTRLARTNSQALEPSDTATPPVSDWFGVRPWLLGLLFGLPWALTAALLLARRRGSSQHPQLQRLLDRLHNATGRQPRQVATEIEEAWRDFLHDRWGLPLGVSRTQWGALLASQGVRRKAANALVQLADDLHYLRHAPKLSSTEELQRELVARSDKLARTIG